MKILRILLLSLLVIFLLPAGLSAALWYTGDHPRSWREADWSSARVLPAAGDNREAAVYVMAARTGGLKGAIAEHSWIVLKERDGTKYERWDVVGWGHPVRQNAYDADGKWYSNVPRIIAEFHGDQATWLIPRMRQAIRAYRYSKRGDYTIFPGPNSNTFVATVLRDVAEVEVTLPPAAVGRDFPVDGSLISFDQERLELRGSIFGYAGFVIGLEVGLEINLFGLVAGFDPLDLSIKVPAFGSYSLS